MSSSKLVKMAVLSMRILSLVWLIFYSANAYSAEPKESAEELFGTWANFIVNGRFGKDNPWLYFGALSLRTTVTGRSSPPTGQTYQLSGVVNHDAIGYRFDDHHSVYVGYAFQYNIPPLARQPTNENRDWEQYSFVSPTPLGQAAVTHKARAADREYRSWYSGQVSGIGRAILSAKR